MKRIIAVLITLVSTYQFAFQQDISGNWSGTYGNGKLLLISINNVNTNYSVSCKMKSRISIDENVPVTGFNYSGDSMKCQFLVKGELNIYKGKFYSRRKEFRGSLFIPSSRLSYPLNLKSKQFSDNQEESSTALLESNKTIFTRQDTLRGSITPEREWWDLIYYHLDVKVNPEDSSIRGSNTIQYKVLKEYQIMQIDLQPPMEISAITQDGKNLDYKRDGNVFYIMLSKKQLSGDINQIFINYYGHPRVAVNAPWDGGFSWSHDSNGNPFVATSCQGLGASVWWPDKDHMYDEVDSMLISINVPETLVGVGNGKLRSIEELNDGTKTYHWFVANPINNYGVNVNVGDYVNFSEKYNGEKGLLDCNYYVLRENLEKAKKHFKQVKLMLEAFEYWFGPYPFYEDGYKLVEVPYLGMEHQSSVTYGNNYLNGYLGQDRSRIGWGLKFDYIIVHESGHEWFANNITYKDIADMWIHESFTTYSENLFLEYYYGKEAGDEYVRGIRDKIRNDKPIIGKYDVNNEGSSDMYVKGANMLHTLRQIVNNDTLWRSVLRGLNKNFYHSTVTTKEIEDYISIKTGLYLEPFFNQYLRTTLIPILEYYYKGNKLSYRWINTVQDFYMPVKVYINGSPKWIQPSTLWTNEYMDSAVDNLIVDPNFYISSFNSEPTMKN